jgi:hypothetical protein
MDELDTPEVETLNFAPVVLKLLQGTLYVEDIKNWQILQDQLQQTSLFFAKIGLNLIVNQEEGLAYLSQNTDDESGENCPRLVKRTPLGFESTVLAVVLRDALEEFDLTNADSRDLLLTAREIKTRLMPYLGGRYDEARVWKQFDRSILQMVRIGFLKDIPTDDQGNFDQRVFQVMRILKVKMGLKELEELKERFMNLAEPLQVDN